MDSELFFYLNPADASSAPAGPMQGKSFAIQSNLSVRDWPTEAGSLALEKFVALEDATVIERLKQAGGHLAGSTRMSELGFSLSGDSMVEVISRGVSDGALMTDMMGEARIVAARSGVYGFKPTNGIVSRYGLIGLAPSMECIGVLARKPALIASVMSILSGRDDRDFSMDEGDLPKFDLFEKEDAAIKTVGYIKEGLDKLDETERSLFLNGIGKLSASGLTVRDINLHDYPYFRPIHQCIGSVEASSSCGKYDGVRYGHRNMQAKNWNDMYLKSRSESFGLLMKTYLFQGAYFQFQNYAAFENACRLRARLTAQINRLWTSCDLLASPTRCTGLNNKTASAAVSDVYDEMLLTLPANVLGTPVIQIPGIISEGQHDPGLQLMGPRFSDMRLLSLAARLDHSVKGGK